MTSPYRAMIARMADELDHYRQLLMDDRREAHALATEARALLAQPVAPAEERVGNGLLPEEPPLPEHWSGDLEYGFEAAWDTARALLAQSVAERPSDEEIADWHDQCADLTRLGEADHYWAFDLRSDEVAGVVCAALARWAHPTPQPVAVSERLDWRRLNALLTPETNV